MGQLIPLFGLIVLLAFGYLMSNNKKQISWRPVLGGLGLGFLFMILTLKFPLGKAFFEAIGNGITNLMHYSNEGTKFVFGGLSNTEKVGFVFAIQVIPSIIFFTVLVGLGYHFGIIPKVVQGFGFVLSKTLKINGSQAMVGAANSFSGMTEAALMVKKYIPQMSPSEVHALMAIGLSTISSELLIPLASLNVRVDLLLTASIVSAPVAIAMSNLMFPNIQKEDLSLVVSHEDTKDLTVLEVIMNSIKEGGKIAMSIVITLIAFIALVYLIDGILGYAGSLFGFSITISQILGYLFTPFAWLMGIPSQDISQVSALFGKKVVFNEFVAYIDLMKIKDTLSEKSVIISTIALCSFSNIAACGITLGGFNEISARKEYSKFIGRALVTSILSFLVVGCMASILF